MEREAIRAGSDFQNPSHVHEQIAATVEPELSALTGAANE
jgi:hypothetical protein